MSEISSAKEVPVGLLSQALVELREARGNPQATREALIRYFRNGVEGNFQIGPLLKWLTSWPNERESVFSQVGAGRDFLEILRKLPVQELGFGLFAAVSSHCLDPEHLPVLHAVRLSADSELESGWRFSSRRESHEFAADPMNYKLVPLKMMIEADHTLAPMRDWPMGTEVTRSEVSDPWRFIVDGRTVDNGKIAGGPSPEVVVPVPVKALQDPAPKVRQLAADALKRIDPESAPKAEER
jgi:hypothetical protein